MHSIGETNMSNQNPLSNSKEYSTSDFDTNLKLHIPPGVPPSNTFEGVQDERDKATKLDITAAEWQDLPSSVTSNQSSQNNANDKKIRVR